LDPNLARIIGIFQTLQDEAMDEHNVTETVVFYQSITARADVTPFVEYLGWR
jgi:hypothetical protein